MSNGGAGLEKITCVLSNQCNLSRERIDTVWPTVLTTLLGSKPKGVKALLTLGHPSHSGFGSSKDKDSIFLWNLYSRLQVFLVLRKHCHFIEGTLSSGILISAKGTVELTS